MKKVSKFLNVLLIASMFLATPFNSFAEEEDEEVMPGDLCDSCSVTDADDSTLWDDIVDWWDSIWE